MESQPEITTSKTARTQKSCDRCGRHYVRDANNQRYCRECRRQKQRIAHRVWARNNYRKNAAELNQYQRERRARKSKEARIRRTQEAEAALRRPPETLPEWFAVQTRFATKRSLAQAVGTSESYFNLLFTGKSHPRRRMRERLFEITQLACFAAPLCSEAR